MKITHKNYVKLNLSVRRGENEMDANERCSNCVYWQFRKCTVTGQVKNDSICNCGQFKKRDENK